MAEAFHTKSFLPRTIGMKQKLYEIFQNIQHHCFIYGYCLMTNHFHLLIQPKEKDNIGLLMKSLGAKYVRYVNKYYKRTGTLWEGRWSSYRFRAFGEKNSILDLDLWYNNSGSNEK